MISSDEYMFNKNFDQWRISLSRNYSPERLGKLISLNLNGLGKTPSQNLVKHQENTWQNTKLATHELGTPKESNKENTNNNYIDNSKKRNIQDPDKFVKGKYGHVVHR